MIKIRLYEIIKYIERKTLRGHLSYRKKLTTAAKTSETNKKEFISYLG